MLDECLTDIITERSTQITSKLAQVLLSECQLVEHLEVMRYYFFMEAGFEYHEFSTRLFAEVSQYNMQILLGILLELE
jgi:hypothetical protein